MSGDTPESGEGPAPTGPPTTVQPPPGGTTDSAPHNSRHVHAHHSAIQFQFLEQLKHRNVIRVGILYLVVCWLILDPVHVLFHMLEVPLWANRLVVILMAVGFPAVLLFAWVYEITPEGLKPTAEVEPHRSIRHLTGQRLNRAIVVVMAMALAYFAADKFWLSKRATIEQAATAASTSAPIVATPTPTTAASPVAVAPVTPAAFSPPEHSVAVLPFTNMSGDPKQDYFSDGLSEELLNALASIRGLQVAARTSSFSFKDKGMDVASIARRLNVGAVLEGSVRKDGGQIRITAQLINAVTGFHMWSHTYDRDLKNVLALQTEIANAVTKELQSTLLVDASTAVELGGTRNPLAFDAYLKARGINVVSKETNLAEIAAYDEAIRLDSRYAKAYAGKAASPFFAGSYEPAATARKVHEQALAIAEKAVQLAPDLAEAHLVFADIYDAGLLEFRHGMTEYERAQALAPGDNRVIRNYAEFLARMGHADSAVANAQRAVTMDPVNAYSHNRLGWVLYFSHRYPEAVAAFDHALSLDSNLPWTYAARGLSYLGLGNFEAARNSCKTPPLFWLNQMCIAIVSDKLGDKAAAQAMLAQMKSDSGEAMAYQYASVYAQRGEIPNALDWLETAYRYKDVGLAWLKVDLLLDPLRGEPRFQVIERKLKFPN